MSSIRSVFVRVEIMKREVNADICNVERHGIIMVGGKQQYLPSAEKKIAEGKRFLATINGSEYSSCTDVGELCNKIQSRINTLKKELIIVGRTSIPMQTGPCVDYRVQMMRIEKATKEATLKSDIEWLEKCIIIAKNRDYFKY